MNGLVCKKCNNGWMSKLETENMDVITDILNFRKVQESIEYLFENSISFSKWAFKNAILFNQATNYRKLVPKEHFTDLYNQKIPDNVFIHIGVSNNDNTISTRQSPIHLIIRDSNLSIDLNKKSYRITFQLKHLLIKVAFYESNNKVYYDDEGAIELYSNKYVFNSLKVFSTIDDFDINGAI